MTSSPPRLVKALQRVVGFPGLVVRHWDLITTSVMRELRGAFTGTVLGFLWPLLNPMFMFAVYYFIFTKLLNFKMPDLPPGQEAAMGTFMFCGVLVWAAFGDSLNRGTGSIVDNGNLIKKVAFPSEVLPLNIVLFNLVTMLFGIAMFLLVCAFTPIWPFPEPLMLLWIPVLLLVQALFTYGVALLLATLYVFLRDTIQVVAIIVTIWMFFTPIFWVANPEIIDGIDAYMPLIEANPLFHLVYAWRDVLMGGRPTYVFEGDTLRSLGVFTLWAVGAFVVGYTFFTLTKRQFADEV